MKMAWGRMTLALCLVGVMWTATYAEDTGSFKVLKIQNDCKYKAEGGFKALAANKEYKFGTELKTGRKSTIDLELLPGNTFRLMPRSRVVVSRNAKNPKLKVLRLQQGTVEVKLDKMPEGHKLQVETPTAVCGALGTRFVVSFEDDAEADKAAKKKGTRENRIACTKGKVFAGSRFSVKGLPAERKTVDAPEIKEGTEIVAVIHEGKENSYADISINRGTITMGLGVKKGGSLTLKPDGRTPARFVCALEKSDGEVVGAALAVKSGVAKHKVRTGFVIKKDVETDIVPDDGAVLLYETSVLKADEKNTAVNEYLAAAKDEAELFTRIVDRTAGAEVAKVDQEALAAAAKKATTLRTFMLQKRNRKLLQQIRRSSRRTTRRPSRIKR